MSLLLLLLLPQLNSSRPFRCWLRRRKENTRLRFLRARLTNTLERHDKFARVRYSSPIFAASSGRSGGCVLCFFFTARSASKSRLHSLSLSLSLSLVPQCSPSSRPSHSATLLARLVALRHDDSNRHSRASLSPSVCRSAAVSHDLEWASRELAMRCDPTQRAAPFRQAVRQSVCLSICLRNAAICCFVCC